MNLVHILGIGFAIAYIFQADKQAFAWVFGKTETFDTQVMHTIHRMMWIGLGTIVISGIFLTVPRWDYLIQQPLFIMKILFVGILFFNGILIGRLMDSASGRSFASLSNSEKIQLMASGAFSTIGWLGAITLGIVLFL